MVELRGRVVVDSTGSPVAGVVVEAFDVSGARLSRSLRESDAATLLTQPSLGSDITDSNGAFTIAFESAAGSTVPIGLVVLAPDEPGRRKRAVLHVVTRVRQTREGRQGYLIALPADLLRRVPASSLPAAPAPAAPLAAVAAAADRASTTANVASGVSRIRSDLADNLRPRREAIEAQVRSTLFERAMGARRLADGQLPPEVLGLDEDVRSKTTSLLNGILRNRANRVTARAIVDVTDADVSKLLDQNGAPLPSVTQNDIETLLFGPSHTDGPPARYRRDSIAVACRSRIPPDARCQPSGGGDGDGGEDGGAAAEASPAEATLSHIKASLLRLLEASEAAVSGTSLGSRATAAELGRTLRALTLAEGPADQTATFTFERLFLASDLLVSHFPDVQVVSDFTDTVLAMQSLGGSLPQQPVRGKDLLDALEFEARTLAAADPIRPAQGSPRVMAMLGLPNPLDAVGDLVGGAVGALGDLFGGGGGSGSRGEGADVRDHRTEPRPRPPGRRDRFADLRSFIERLRRIRREDYGFTAFAADRNGRTSTYGLLLGYEQEWRPKGYQAGELVKTIPLAPKSSDRKSVV